VSAKSTKVLRFIVLNRTTVMLSQNKSDNFILLN